MKQPPDEREADTKPDDGALFRAAIGQLNPLPGQNRIVPTSFPLPARVRDSAAHHAVADTLSDFPFDNPPDNFLRDGVSRLTLRKLKRGNYPIQGELDLHGYQSDEARQLLQAFLHEAAQQELRCVRVIHGKGMNSRGGEAVLRRLTRNWLTQHPQVLAFCAAPPGMGGDGAVVILLKVSGSGN